MYVPWCTSSRYVYLTPVWSFVFSALGRRDPLEVEYEPQAPPPESATTKALLLVFATVGLLGSYITWGFMQEMVWLRGEQARPLENEARFFFRCSLSQLRFFCLRPSRLLSFALPSLALPPFFAPPLPLFRTSDPGWGFVKSVEIAQGWNHFCSERSFCFNNGKMGW